MAFGAVKTPAEEKRPFNIRDVDTSTNQETIPVPYFAGVATLPLTWVTPMYNLTSKEADSGGGGKGSGKAGGGGGEGQKKWYADIGGISNVCPDDAPNDALLHVIVNDEPSFSGPLSRVAGQFYVAFSIPNFAQECRFYWGTKNQPIDDLILSQRGGDPSNPNDPDYHPGFDPRDRQTYPLKNGGDRYGDMVAGSLDPQSGHYDGHSGYRNQGLFVARQFHIGSTPNMPNVALVLARGTKFFAGARFEAAETGVNPMGPAFEILTDNMIGGEMPVARLRRQSFEDTAAAIASIKVAPVAKQVGTLRAFLAGRLAYYDGFYRRQSSLLEAGHFSRWESINVPALPVFDSNDLVGEPNIKPGSLDDTKNVTNVVFTNREKWWREDTATGKDLANWLDQGRQVNDDLRMEDFIDAEITQRYADQYIRTKALKLRTGTSVVKRGSVNGLMPGDRFRLDVASVGIEFVWRLLQIERASDRDGTLKLTVENERALGPTPYTQPRVKKRHDFVIRSSAITNVRIIELPSGELKTARGVEIAILAQRPSAAILGARVHFSEDQTTYDRIGQIRTFATFARVVNEPYPADTPILDTNVGLQVDLFGVDLRRVASQSPVQRAANTLLLFIGNEIISVGAVQALGQGKFRIFGRRALYGTPRENHFLDTECWFMPRDKLVTFRNENFVLGTTRWFKLQPYTHGQDHPLDDVDEIPYTFGNKSSVGAPFSLQLRSAGGVTSDGKMQVRIFATWDNSPDQDVFLFACQWRRVGAEWKEETTREAGANWVVQPRTPYEVRVRGINSYGKEGEWSPIEQITSATATPFRISGLELAGQGNDPVFIGRDAHFEWRLNSPDGAGDDVSAVPVTNGLYDPVFDEFIIEVLDAFTRKVVFTTRRKTPSFSFTYELNAAAEGPRRRFIFRVTGKDSFGELTNSEAITVMNPAPNVLVGVAVTKAVLSVHLRYQQPTDRDWQGVIVWRSGASGFAPDEFNIIYEGSDTEIVLTQGAGVTRYYRLAAYDAFGRDLLNLTDEIAVTNNYIEELDLAEELRAKLNISDSVAAGLQVEITSRVEGDLALANQDSILYALSGNNAAAIALEQTVRTDADSATATQLGIVQSDIGANAAAVIEEASTRATNDGALSGRITAVVATAAGNTAAISAETTARANQNLALADDIQIVSARLADSYTALLTFDFDDGAEGWAFFGGTLTQVTEAVQLASAGADPIFQRGGLSFSGQKHTRVRMRLRRISGAGWEGHLFWGTTTRNFFDSGPGHYRTIPVPIAATNQWQTLEWDMSADAEWRAGTITALRIDLGNSSSDIFQIDWISIGRVSPGTLQAQITEEALARVSADGTIAAQWGVALDINGHVVGYIKLSGTQQSSKFSILADKFEILAPDGAGGVRRVSPFSVGRNAANTITEVVVAVNMRSDTFLENGDKGYRFTPDGTIETRGQIITDGVINDTLDTPIAPDSQSFETDVFPIVFTGIPANSEVRYRLNGFMPLATGPVYNGPFAISESRVVRWRAFGTGVNAGRKSEPGIATYTKIITKDPAPMPYINKVTGSSGTRGSVDYRVNIVSTLPGPKTIKLSLDGGASFVIYSPTGNYRTGSGTPMPTGNIGTISMEADAGVLTYVVAPGYAPSGNARFYNTSTAPGGTGDGGWDGPPGTNPP